MKRARTVKEIDFATSLQPCPQCGERETGASKLRTLGATWLALWNCPQCQAERKLELATFANPVLAPRPEYYELGQGVSELIEPETFLEELVTAQSKIPAEPTGLDVQRWRTADAQIKRALICANELLKMVPAGADRVPDTTDSPPCDLEVQPTSLNFGVMASGTKELAFTLRNRLTGANDFCTLSNLRIPSQPAGLTFSLPGATTSIDLAPGERRVVAVRATVTGQATSTAVTAAAAVSFNVADPVSPSRQLPLSATLVQPCLSISPTSADFGTVATSCGSGTRTFQLFNLCTGDVLINATAMTQMEFSTVTGLAPGTRVMPGAASPITFSLQYRPVDQGVDRGAFVLSVVQNGQPVNYVIPLAGIGGAAGMNLDTFVNPMRPRADVLLVIDDSCSMSSRQAAIAQEMNSLLAFATANAVDFQLGVTNTELAGQSSAYAGLLHATQNGQKILRPTTPNLAVQFADLVDVGNAGSTESCLAPATRALTPPNITDPMRNGGFLRDDASLGVICFTDAREQAPQVPAFYVNQLLSLKAPGQFTYSVMGPFQPSPPTSCIYDDPNDGRHQAVVNQTGGIIEEICTPNWSSALMSLGAIAFGRTSTGSYFLKVRPDQNLPAIQVHVDGVAVPSTDPNGRMIWTYDSMQNAITFDPQYVPQPGQTVTVGYTGICYP